MCLAKGGLEDYHRIRGWLLLRRAPLPLHSLPSNYAFIVFVRRFGGSCNVKRHVEETVFVFPCTKSSGSDVSSCACGLSEGGGVCGGGSLSFTVLHCGRRNLPGGRKE